MVKAPFTRGWIGWSGRLFACRVAIVFAVQFVVAIGNTGMQSVLPAIGREIGIADPLVAAIYSLSALLWAAGAPFWATRSDVRGRKPLIVLGLIGFIVSMLGCTAVIYIGGAKFLPPLVVFVLFLLARAIFGFFGSAATPSSQAYLAERTTREKRTDAIAGLAGAFGLGTIVGPAIAPLFILPVLGLAGPTFLIVVIELEIRNAAIAAPPMAIISCGRACMMTFRLPPLMM